MEVKPNPPGALRSALFQDVPYILDSLWRWGEFRVNRLGSVNSRSLTATSCGPHGKAAHSRLFALMCLFAIFGPTSDALCALAARNSQPASVSS